MKGIIFTEFSEMVESVFGFDTLDAIIERSDLPSGGNYTAVGTYDHREMVSLVIQLSEISGMEVPVLLRTFGTHLFHRFATIYPEMVSDDNALSFLNRVETHIHREVLKLYPNAELPRFETRWISADELEMVYHSSKHLEDVAEGLIVGCLEHFGETADVVREPGDAGAEGVKFRIRRQRVPAKA
ncbi:MAG: heme NO-binding domain-containing protein [Verrucomicrobiae bacterium]|nr:heme NO-binding domain-containing protein [Verrucomicrobiae bacterium]MCB1085432.1 heme NO-binding domain-containing protein [Verrucomicrobiae bacterium]MCB1089896.1 heme NO-binding domain-containing protein [Verrucomicrobiae bacterium]